MREGEASITARRVAARRLTFDRAPAPYGDSSADERLARDVAGSVDADATDWMTNYLRARTTFFDRVVVGSLDRGLRQGVIAAAGYDARALRYAKPRVRWFEVDHPDTQGDKRARLDRLGIDTSHVAFVAADFSIDDVARGLAAAGHDTAEPSLFLCEGVAIYLERSVLESLLRQLRAAAADGSRLAISLSVETESEDRKARRAAFQSAVAAIGEPARTVLTSDEVGELLTATGWRVVDSAGSERSRRAGLLVLEPASGN